jgi:hypothetical protein
MSTRVNWIWRLLTGVIAATSALLHWPHNAEGQTSPPRRSVEDRLAEFGEAALVRLKPAFDTAKIAWPPARFALLGFKHERTVELWAASRESDRARWIKTYLVRAASGRLGPKLRQGDLQVPEGVYRIELLNPNSKYHVSLRLNYPNEDDRKRGEEDGRDDLGGDIMIHGRAVSIGCIALGDEGAEELFLLAARAGLRSGEVILSPVDFRLRELPEDVDRVDAPCCVGLYKSIRERLEHYTDE